MTTLLVEIKNEYTIHLVNILAPLIFEGIQSIYNDAKNMSDRNDEINFFPWSNKSSIDNNGFSVLKIFQSCLKSIITWNHLTIDNETQTNYYFSWNNQ